MHCGSCVVFLNRPRTRLGVNCAVFRHRFSLIRLMCSARKSGWNYHLLTEDIEFSIAQCGSRP